MEEVKTYDNVWFEIEKTIKNMALTIFEIKKVCLPSEYYEIFKDGFLSGEEVRWCGKPVIKVNAKVIYFIVAQLT